MSSFFESVGKKIKGAVEAVDKAGNKLGRDLNVPGARETYKADLESRINRGDKEAYKKKYGK